MALSKVSMSSVSCCSVALSRLNANYCGANLGPISGRIRRYFAASKISTAVEGRNIGRREDRR